MNRKEAALQLPIGSSQGSGMGQKGILRTQPTRVRYGWNAKGVYKLKEEHESGGRKKKKERKKEKKRHKRRKVERRKGEEKKKRFVLVTREKYPGYQLKNLGRS